MTLRLLIVLMSLPLMICSEQFVVQKKKKQSTNAQKERLAECHAEIAQCTNTIIQQTARVQKESHDMLKNITEGKSINSLATELEKAEKKLATLKRCCHELDQNK